MGKRPTPDAPHTGKRRPPRAPSCRPHSAQSQLARARPVGHPTGSTQPEARQGGSRTGPPPPQKGKPKGARDRGRTRAAARTAWNGPTGALHRDRARCARHTDSGRGTWGGADGARARAHAHAKDTRGIPEGQPDRARGTHRPHGMAYQRARIRDPRTGRPATQSVGNAGRERGNGEDTKPGNGPNAPEPAASDAHTRPWHCTRQGSSCAPRHAPAPRLGSLRASPRGSYWRQASSTGPLVPAPGQLRIRGATRWVSACSYGCQAMH